MTDESVSALAADPEPVVETEGQEVEQTDQTAEVAEDPAAEEKASAAKERRERDKANKARLRDERDAALKEAATLKAQVDQLKARQSTAPTEADHADPFILVAKQTAHEVQQALMAERAGTLSEAEKAAQSRAQEAEKALEAVRESEWAAQVADAKSRYADFEAVALAGDVPISEGVARLVQTSDLAADLAYHLGKNKAQAAEISAMSPLDAARAIGRIEATLSRPKPRTETKAPDPINPVKGGASVKKNPWDLPTTEFDAWRKAGGTITL